MSKNKPPKEPRDDYEVGYGKPPKHTQFKPGQSGNRRGRPKGAKNLKTDLQEELSERILIREGDQSRRVSKQRALVKALMAQAVKGNARAASLVTSMMMRLLDTGEGAPEVEAPLEEGELEILLAYEDRIRAHSSSDEGETETARDPKEDS